MDDSGSCSLLETRQSPLLSSAPLSNSSKLAQSCINRFGVPEDSCDIFVKHNHVTPYGEPLCILTAHSAAEIILLSHLVYFFVFILLIHRFFALVSSPLGR